ncbi:hypothetical protein [Avibacterium avium]|uniref:hypothetical protein n=1 Tax=Avibacterium avium TaxID=751 RepID=UPI003BF7D4EA
MKNKFIIAVFISYIMFVFPMLIILLILAFYVSVTSEGIYFIPLLEDFFSKFWIAIFIVPLIPSVGVAIDHIRKKSKVYYEIK